MNFKDIVGKVLNFHGVEGNYFCVSLPGVNELIAFEVREDENDGYRSMLDDIIEVSVKGHIFFKDPIDIIKIESVKRHPTLSTFTGYSVKDMSMPQHEWLYFGTDYADDYYPCFIFHYEPKRSQVVKV